MSPTIVLKQPPVAATTTTTAISASPKSAKNKSSASISATTSYGCDHVRELLNRNPKIPGLYTSATRVALDPVRTTAQSCGDCECRFRITRMLLCMQCPKVHCLEDARRHSVDSEHVLGIDSRSCHVYCFRCEDFIYDPTLEEIRMEREASVEGNPARKRRRIDTNPSADDLKCIETNTSAAPCRATGLRGFLNMGSTCFMSVVLQSLIHNPLVRNFYLSDGHRPKECTPNCMSCAMDEVFSEFFATDKVDGFGPVNLLTRTWKCEQTLAGCQQRDAHEYLQFLLNQLHMTNGGTADKDDPCKCIIHRSFYGKLQSDVTCERCTNVTTTCDPVMDLSLDLRIKTKKKINVPLEGAEQTLQTLQECLERFTSSEKLGVDGYNCVYCPQQGQSALKQLTVKQLPPVLCIQLKRFGHSDTGSSKINAKIRFPMQLDMTPYTTRSHQETISKLAPDGITKTTSRPTGLYLYDLLSVVVHIGDKINSGHYVSYSRENGQNPRGKMNGSTRAHEKNQNSCFWSVHKKQWFRFDDSVVTLATEKDVLGEQAYLLFYVVRNLC